MDALQIGFAIILSPAFFIMLGIAIWGYFDHRKAKREWERNADILTERMRKGIAEMEQTWREK